MSRFTDFYDSEPHIIWEHIVFRCCEHSKRVLHPRFLILQIRLRGKIFSLKGRRERPKQTKYVWPINFVPCCAFCPSGHVDPGAVKYSFSPGACNTCMMRARALAAAAVTLPPQHPTYNHPPIYCAHTQSAEAL